MRRNRNTRNILAVIAGLVAMFSIACNQTGGNAQPASASDGKIPITTKSEEARKEFLEGRNLSERLLGQDSLQHFDKAISLDPEFATAELNRAINAPTAKEFLEHLNRAVALADKASDGERLLILATQAGANAEVVKQKEYLEKLVAAYPSDERAHLNVGVYHFGQQAFPEAIEQLKKATELAPNHSPAYNMLGYSYRQIGDYANAEQAFKKYIELIPNDPNPYDSYAELLLKMGRFDDSVVEYRKALLIDPHFVPSHFGISADLTYQGKPQEAESELQQMADQARNDGELRTAYFGMAVLAADGGKFDKAQQAMDKQYGVAEKKNDVAAMSADLQAKGNISLEAQKYDVAAQQFERSFQMVQDSSLSQQIKDNAKLLHHFNLTAVAIGKKDYTAAKTHAEEFRQGAEATGNPVQIRLAHELAGRIALAQKDYAKAVSELGQANQQDPRNLYRLSQAYQAKGDSAKAKDFLAKVANFNSLPALNYAFVRTKAQKQVAGNKA